MSHGAVLGPRERAVLRERLRQVLPAHPGDAGRINPPGSGDPSLRAAQKQVRGGPRPTRAARGSSPPGERAPLPPEQGRADGGGTAIRSPGSTGQTKGLGSFQQPFSSFRHTPAGPGRKDHRLSPWQAAVSKPLTVLKAQCTPPSPQETLSRNQRVI